MPAFTYVHDYVAVRSPSGELSRYRHWGNLVSDWTYGKIAMEQRIRELFYHSKGATMKVFIYCSVFVLLAVMSFPMTAEAFGRRSHGSDFSQSQAVTAPLQTTDVSPNAVPEPPALLLMGIGFGVLAAFAAIKRYRKQDA